MSRAGRGRDQPRAMIHRRILDVAAANPEASLASLADEVSGASVTLVERVLDEYGDPSRESASDDAIDQPMEQTNAPDDDTESTTDPAAGAVPDDDTESTTDPAAGAAHDEGSDTTADPAASSTDAIQSEASTESESRGSDDSAANSTSGAATAPEAVLDEGALSEKQRRTLRAVYERPSASQGDLADELDVTRATVSRRLNAIPGFEWADRQAFANSAFEGESGRTRAADSEVTESAASEQNEAKESDSSAERDEHVRAGPGAENGSGPAAGEEPASVEGDDPVLSALVDVRSSLSALDERVTALEAQESSAPTEAIESLSPELAHRVVHACMDSDRISEDEELEVLRTFMRQ